MSEIVQGKPQNEATEKELRTRSTFNETYDFFQTMRFGEYTPHFVMEGVNNDNLPLHSAHTIRSYTLGAPLMSDIKINKDYFFVPMQAILPLNWSKWYENPVIGQDVPNDCGPSVENFWDKVGTLFTNSWNYLKASPTNFNNANDAYDKIAKGLVFFERLYSDGSLMSNLGIHGGQFFVCGIDDGNGTYDDWFNYVIKKIFEDRLYFFKIQYGSNTSQYYWVKIKDNPGTRKDRIITMRDYLEYLRDDFSWTIVDRVAVDATEDETDLMQEVGQIDMATTPAAYTNSGVHCDLRRMWAYQIVCFHYFTNDKVDYIYSADLFRQYIDELATRTGSAGVIAKPSFTVNGLQYQYDALSAYNFNTVISNFTNGIFGYSSATVPRSDNINEAYAYFRALLGFNNSLRYKDYFTGGRTRPLAVGDTTQDAWTPVVSGYVGAIDITRNIQKQRYLNAINRIPHQIEDYLEGLFGKRPAPDYHNPFFLARTTDQVFGQESEYTGNVTDAEKNNITSVLRGQANRYAFDFKPDRDCVVIGITSFDLPRAYSRTIERQAMHLTRFDGFNPYMQFVGDQPIYRAELSPYTVDMNPFAYTLRHMEYKQRYNQVAGGFKRYLPGWAFLAEDNTRPYISNIDPEFIRSHNTELDKYFKSLTGYSLGSYFHFIVKNNNSMNASRPMAYAPSIL